MSSKPIFKFHRPTVSDSQHREGIELSHNCSSPGPSDPGLLLGQHRAVRGLEGTLAGEACAKRKAQPARPYKCLGMGAGMVTRVR